MSGINIIRLCSLSVFPCRKSTRKRNIFNGVVSVIRQWNAVLSVIQIHACKHIHIRLFFVVSAADKSQMYHSSTCVRIPQHDMNNKSTKAEIKLEYSWAAKFLRPVKPMHMHIQAKRTNSKFVFWIALIYISPRCLFFIIIIYNACDFWSQKLRSSAQTQHILPELFVFLQIARKLGAVRNDGAQRITQTQLTVLFVRPESFANLSKWLGEQFEYFLFHQREITPLFAKKYLSLVAECQEFFPCLELFN